MIAASSLAFPAAKHLATWWRQLAAFQPQALWVGHLLLHRLELLAEVLHAEEIDPLARHVLAALSLEQSAETVGTDWLDRLDDRLHLGAGVIQRIVQGLQDQGLVDAHFTLAHPGLQVLEKGHLLRPAWQRRELVFLERCAADGQRILPPQFLPLHGGSGPTWQPDDRSRFPMDLLFACVAQPAAWKEQWAFPAEVLNIADPAQPGDSPPSWQRVIVDRPERLLMVLIACGPDQRLLGFAARQEGWELHSRQPVLNLPAAVRPDIPDLASTPIELWNAAWQSWCKAHAIPAAEFQDCVLIPQSCSLHIQAPAALLARLTAAKSEALRGETWLLAGAGYLRATAQVEFALKVGHV